MNDSNNSIIIILAKESFFWLITATTLGLLHMWLFIGNYWIQAVDVDWNSIFESGVFLFFSSGIITSNSFSVWMEKKIDKGEYLNIFIHIILPFIVYGVIVWLYLNLYTNSSSIDRIIYMQTSILVYTIAYSTICKVQLKWTKFITKESVHNEFINW